MTVKDQMTICRDRSVKYQNENDDNQKELRENYLKIDFFFLFNRISKK